ncbi:MAG: hypothetical protein AB1807_22710 [Pseudomonadota bacterium]
MKYLAIAFALILPCVASFYAGVFSTSFNTNMCYSNILSTLAEQAKSAAASGNQAEMDRYARMIDDLPNAGYESDCAKIELALQRQIAAQPAK